MNEQKKNAKTLLPSVTIGKNGLTENQVNEITINLKIKKLVKIKLLPSVDADPKVLSEEIAQKTKSKIVSVVGRSIVVWKR